MCLASGGLLKLVLVAVFTVAQVYLQQCPNRHPWSQYLNMASVTCEKISRQHPVGENQSIGSTSTSASRDTLEVREGGTNALAVVPYEENTILPHLKPYREFTFAGHKLKINQNWSELGVAAVVWDAAVVLGEYLEGRSHLVRGRGVVELGSGSGLAGMVAALLGGQVTVTERAEAMDFLRRTVEANLDLSQVSLTLRELDWTKPLGQWSTPDVILGADIVYIEDTFPDLLRVLQQLAGPDTLVLLSCRIRYQRDSTFLGMLKSHFEVKKVFYDKLRDVSIYSAKKVGSQ